MRFLSLNTEVATAVVIQRIFFCSSTLAASGTACALAIDADHDLDLLLIDQPLDLVDRDVDLALRIGVDRLDLVFAGNAAALVAQIDRDLRADRGGDRAAGRERAGQVVDRADADGFGLRGCEAMADAQRGDRRGGAFEQRPA